MGGGSQPCDRTRRSSSARVGVTVYRSDPLYPRIVAAVALLLTRGKVVAPVDVLVGMGVLHPTRLEGWRFGRVPYLEQVIEGSLPRLSRLLRILRFHAHDLNLVPSTTVYMRWGSGPKQQLRFTKTGDRGLEQAYSSHYVWPGKGPFHPPRPTGEARQDEPGAGRLMEEEGVIPPNGGKNGGNNCPRHSRRSSTAVSDFVPGGSEPAPGVAVDPEAGPPVSPDVEPPPRPGGTRHPRRARP